MEIINESTVPEQFNNQRIDKYLAARFNYQSRTKWQAEIENGKLFYNGKKLTNYHKKIKTGDIISYKGRDFTEPEVDPDYSILYEDDYIVGINKPGNLPVHPAGRFFHNTLLTILEKDFNMKLFPVHRLDRETSGTIIFSKNREIVSKIHKNFHEFKKSYLAIVHGNTEKENFSVEVPIGDDKNSKVRKKRQAYTGARENAITHFKKVYSFKEYTLLKAVPVTGRLHQIRVHLQYSGYPILGDKLYGLNEEYYLEFIKSGNSEELLSKLFFPRSALHSRTVSFFHPGLNKHIIIKAPLPEDFKKFIKSNHY